MGSTLVAGRRGGMSGVVGERQSLSMSDNRGSYHTLQPGDTYSTLERDQKEGNEGEGEEKWIKGPPREEKGERVITENEATRIFAARIISSRGYYALCLSMIALSTFLIIW